MSDLEQEWAACERCGKPLGEHLCFSDPDCGTFLRQARSAQPVAGMEPRGIGVGPKHAVERDMEWAEALQEIGCQVDDFEPIELSNVRAIQLQAKCASLEKQVAPVEPDWHSFYTDSQSNLYHANELLSAAEAKVSALEAQLKQSEFFTQLCPEHFKSDLTELVKNGGLKCPACLMAERDRLKEALRNYGMHRMSCPEFSQKANQFNQGCVHDSAFPCNCGLNSALGDLAKQSEN